MERARADYYQDKYYRESRQIVTGRPARTTSVKTITRTWRFKPRTIWPFVMWGLVLFIGFKITVLPLIEGVCSYIAGVKEIKQLDTQYVTMRKQLTVMEKKRDDMKTPAYVELRAHQIGLVKPEEAQMVVMEGAPAGTVPAKKNSKKRVEIGD